MAAEEKASINQMLSSIWWLVLLRGILIIFMGIILISRPLPTLMVLVMFMGFYWFFDGILTIVAAIRGRKSHKDWGWGVFVGSISTLAGIIIFTQPLMSTVIGATFLIYLIAFMILGSGIWSLVTGFRLRKTVKNEWSMILSGLLSVIFALLLLANPVLSAMTIVWLVGLFALVGGIALIIISLRIRKVTV